MADSTAAERALLMKLDAYFRSSLDHPTWRAFREHAVKCFRYRENEQWSPAELAELARRGQPPSVNNQVSVTIDRMVGQFVQTRTRIACRGRNAPSDEPVANVLTDVLLFIRQSCDEAFEERDCFQDGATCGFGVLEAYVTFDDLMQPEVRVRAIDPLEVFADPWSRRYNWNEDSRFCARGKWLEIGEAVELFPAKATLLRQLSSDGTFAGALSGVDGFRNDAYVDFEPGGNRVRRVRVVEMWHKEREREVLLISTDEDGRPVTIAESEASEDQKRAFRKRGVREIERIKNTMRVSTFVSGILLEDKESPDGGEMFRWVPFFVQRRKNGEPYSLIWTAIPLQDAINKRESKALHLLNTNQAIYETNSIADKVELANELARPDGQIEVRKLEGFRLEKNTDLAQTQFVMHQEAKSDFRKVTGVNPDALGEKSEVRSGIGIQRKQAMTDVILTPLFDNFRRTRAILARLKLALIQAYYTEEKVFLITNDLGATRAVHYGPDAIQGIKERLYDVAVEDVPDTTTIQQEQAQMFLQVFPQLMQLGPGPARLALKMTELRNKDELDQLLVQMSAPPPADPKFSVAIQWEALSPEEKVAFAGRLGMPALAQAEQENPQKTTAQTKKEAEIARAEIHAQSLTDGQRADKFKALVQANAKMVGDQQKSAAGNGAL